MPALQEFYETYGDQVDVVGIDYQDTQPRAALELAAVGVTYPLVADPGGDINAADPISVIRASRGSSSSTPTAPSPTRPVASTRPTSSRSSRTSTSGPTCDPRLAGAGAGGAASISADDLTWFTLPPVATRALGGPDALRRGRTGGELP